MSDLNRHNFHCPRFMGCTILSLERDYVLEI